MNWKGLQEGKRKGKKRSSLIWAGRFINLTDSDRERTAYLLRKTTKLCSCRGCGNQRKYEGVTIQERKWLERAEEWNELL